MRTRYTKLHTVWENEIKREELQNISDDFLHEMKNYTTQLNKTTTNPETLSGRLTQTERSYANQMLNEIIELRLNKIIKSELNGLPINAQAMTPEEQKLHSNLRQLLLEYKQSSEHIIIKDTRSQIQPTLQKTQTPSQPTSRHDEKGTELLLVRFLKPLPAIMGIDMKAYGPFQPEELATIPRQNAENLIKRGIAKKVNVES
jgi:DNA replication initiation complex subunit (GINS family)